MSDYDTWNRPCWPSGETIAERPYIPPKTQKIYDDYKITSNKPIVTIPDEKAFRDNILPHIIDSIKKAEKAELDKVINETLESELQDKQK